MAKDDKKDLVAVIGHSFRQGQRIACYYGLVKDSTESRDKAVVKRFVGEKFYIHNDPPDEEEKARRKVEIDHKAYKRRWSESQKKAYLQYNDFMPEGMKLAGDVVAAGTGKDEDDQGGADDKPVTLKDVKPEQAIKLIDKELDKTVLLSWKEAEEAEAKPRKAIVNALKAKLEQ